jgi:hypothetical protein
VTTSASDELEGGSDKEPKDHVDKVDTDVEGDNHEDDVTEDNAAEEDGDIQDAYEQTKALGDSDQMVTCPLHSQCLIIIPVCRDQQSMIVPKMNTQPMCAPSLPVR